MVAMVIIENSGGLPNAAERSVPILTPKPKSKRNAIKIMKNLPAEAHSTACSQSVLRLLACTLAGLALITSAAAQTTYTITDLGTLPGADNVSAYGLND